MTEPNPEKRFCLAIKLDGAPCHGWPDKSGLCPAHRPGAHEIRVYAGQCRSKQHQLETRLNPRLRPILDLLANAIRETHQGTLQPARAQAMAALASALVRVTDYAEFSQRLEKLEQDMESAGLIA